MSISTDTPRIQVNLNMWRPHCDAHSLEAFPEEHWKKIQKTNIMERINKELMRRSKVVGVFPNEESLLRLVVSILIDINEEFIIGNGYLLMKN